MEDYLNKARAAQILSLYGITPEDDLEKAKTFQIGQLDKSGKNVKTIDGWKPVKSHSHLVTADHPEANHLGKLSAEKHPVSEPEKTEVKPETEKKGDINKYKDLDQSDQINVHGITHKLELVKHNPDPYSGDLPTYHAKIIHPETGEIKVIPHAVKFHTGYDQGMNVSNKQQYYADFGGYGTRNGGGQTSAHKPYVETRHREHLAELFEGKKNHYGGNYKNYHDSIRSYPKGTKNDHIRGDNH